MNRRGSSLATASRPHDVRIWDLPVRLFHWLLAGMIAATAITGFLLDVTWLQVHILSGSAAGCLILARLVWGFTGTAYARFSSYDLKPAAVFRHLKDIRHGRVEREAGHNSLGSWMVVALIAVVGFIVSTGLVVLGGQFKQGPLKSLLSFATGGSIRELHETAAIVLLVLVGFHIAGAIFESLRTRENLPRSMITGNKRAGFAHPLATVRSRPVTSLLAVVLLAAVVAGGSAWLMVKPPFGVHAVVADAQWKDECSACHIAFPPSLLPAKSWNGLMANLDDHFGENASLDEVAAHTIAQFLVANSAETQDSLPGNRFRKVDDKRPFEITATPFWKRMHGDIPDFVFSQKAIGARQNCVACHGDALTTAMFAPQSISIPKE